MGWREDRARRRRAREMERALRELEKLDRRLGQATYPAPIFEVSERPRRRRRGRFLPLLVAILVTVGAVQLQGPRPTGDGSPTLLDRLARAAGSLSGGLDRGLVYDDGLDGESGSGGPGYSFARLQPDGVSPATWPCEGSIPVEVNPAGAPAGYESIIGSAIARINDASGFSFEVVGETTDRNFLERGVGPVLLGFSDGTEIELLAGDAAGIGGATYARDSGGGPITAVGGVLALDTEVVTDDSLEFAEVILLHELAHVLGLGHTDSPGQLMRATGTGQRDFGAGDRAGLAHLRDAACG
ncbi:MAG: hypothetical protein ABR500_02995 [Dermatophilaceae bacterium]|nr:hypothetical protein [Intrasporangiaceae bacterium]